MKSHGRRTEAVIGAGKSGFVVAVRAADGKRLWKLPVGRHNRYQAGPFPTKPVTYCPGSLGGVLTPMAEGARSALRPLDRPLLQGLRHGTRGRREKSGGLAAVVAATGHVRWEHRLPTLDSGAGDVVFTSTYDGMIYALSTKTGATLWRTKAPGGNSFPAVTKTMLIVGVGARTSAKAPPPGEIVAYSLRRPGQAPVR